jgi:hypothetical protein
MDTRALTTRTRRESHVRRVIRWITETWAECDYVGRRRLEIMLGTDFTSGKRPVRPTPRRPGPPRSSTVERAR